MPPMKTLEQLRFDNSYARLPGVFHSRVRPNPQGKPYLVAFNPAAARLLDLDPAAARRPDFPRIFAGYELLPGMDPVSAAYAGHQFGVWVPQLGDGRAHLLGEVVNDRGERWDLQLKGAGTTPYSRMGDGRAVLRSTIREFLAGEAMAGLGIPTTRALCITGSEAPVYRETVETGATLTRIAPSHVRFGSFEYFSHSGRHEQLRQLADYVIHHHYPQFRDEPPAERHALWFAEVVVRTAQLVAQWQGVGFAHGVLNTDNMSILGLTLDYGPYGFMDAYRPGWICNHSDPTGRYAFDRQPGIGLWNLHALAHALTPLVDQDALKAALDGYGQVYEGRYLALMQAKLGLAESRPGDPELIRDFLSLLAAAAMDYTNTFRALGAFQVGGDNAGLRDRFPDRAGFDGWARRYAERLTAEGGEDAARRRSMDAVNPHYVLRNYLAQTAIAKAMDKDFSEIQRLRELLADPYAERPGFAAYAAEPPDWAERVQVSCSS